jgi:hypothetical protein
VISVLPLIVHITVTAVPARAITLYTNSSHLRSIIYYDLFNDALNNLYYIAFCYMMAIYNEVERLWKTVGVVQFAVPFQNLPRGTELNHEDPRSG